MRFVLVFIFFLFNSEIAFSHDSSDFTSVKVRAELAADTHNRNLVSVIRATEMLKKFRDGQDIQKINLYICTRVGQAMQSSSHFNVKLLDWSSHPDAPEDAAIIAFDLMDKLIKSSLRFQDYCSGKPITDEFYLDLSKLLENIAMNSNTLKKAADEIGFEIRSYN